MKRHILITLLMLTFLVNACGISATEEPTPTSTPLPPTSTPTPSATPTLVPTATPDKAATVAAKATQAADEVRAELDVILAGEELNYQDGRLLWQQETPLFVDMVGPQGMYQEFAEGEVVKNFILKSDVTWEATGILVCGFFFRSEKDFREGKQYEFVYLRLSGAPAWAINFNEFGYSKNSPTRVKYSSAVDLTNGATNELVLVANQGEFTVFINGIRQGKYYDYSEQSKEGMFAIIGSQDSGEGRCQYDNTFVWELK